MASYIQKAHPRYDWERFQLAEPIPLIINNTLKITIITSDGGGVISIDLVDVQTGNVYSICILYTSRDKTFPRNIQIIYKDNKWTSS